MSLAVFDCIRLVFYFFIRAIRWTIRNPIVLFVISLVLLIYFKGICFTGICHVSESEEEIVEPVAESSVLDEEEIQSVLDQIRTEGLKVAFDKADVDENGILIDHEIDDLFMMLFQNSEKREYSKNIILSKGRSYLTVEDVFEEGEMLFEEYDKVMKEKVNVEHLLGDEAVFEPEDLEKVKKHGFAHSQGPVIHWGEMDEFELKEEPLPDKIAGIEYNDVIEEL